MRGAIFLLATAVTLGGCATSSPGWGHDFYGNRRAEAGVPGSTQPRLRADLWYSDFSGDISFQISQPAYVAIFAVRPGWGTRMLYPDYSGEDNFLYDGYHSLDNGYRLRSHGWGFGMSWRDPYGPFGPLDWMGPAMGHYGAVYASATYSPFGASGGYYGPYGYGYGYGYGYASYAPTYLFLVASAEPLMTDRLVGRTLQGAQYASFSPYAAMDRLVDATVRYPLSSQWTTAVYIIWPRQRAYMVGYSGWERFICQDGRTIWLRQGYYPPASCFGPHARRGERPHAGQDSTGTGEPPDTSGVIKIPVRPWMPPVGPGEGGEVPPWPRDRAEGEGPGNTGSTQVPSLRLPVGVTGGENPAGTVQPGENGRTGDNGKAGERRRGDQGETTERPAPPTQRPAPPTQRPAPPPTQQPPVPVRRPSPPARPVTRPAPPPKPSEPPSRPARPETRPSPPPPSEPPSRPSRPETRPSPPPRPSEPPSRPSRPETKPSPPPQPSQPASRPSPPPRPSRPETKPSPPPRPSQPASRPSPPPRPQSRPSRPPPKPRDPPPGLI